MVEIFNADETLNADKLIKFAECVAEKEGLKNTINIIFVDEGFIAELNKKYKNKSAVTDILTFVYDDNNIDGELYICKEVAFENALKEGKTKEEELLFLIAHGILHIKGHTHETEEKFDKMMKIQEEYLIKCT